MRIAVTGASGFLGGHLVKRLIADGHEVTAIGRRRLDEWLQVHPEAANLAGADLRSRYHAFNALMRIDRVYHLAADMGGRLFTDSHDSACAMNAMLDLSVLTAAVQRNVGRLLYASSACVYPPATYPLAEGDVVPLQPDGLYGLAKVYGEQAALAFAHDHPGLSVRIARLDGVYGLHCDYASPRAKAPAALIRKAELHRRTGAEVEIIGDGFAKRAYAYVGDVVDALVLLMDSHVDVPVNIGSEDVATIDQLAAIAMRSADLARMAMRHTAGPTGPAYRALDITRARLLLGWSPTTSLEDGMARTRAWIAADMDRQESRQEAARVQA